MTTRFGLFLTPDAGGYRELVRQVALAEEAGLDVIGIQDHPYQRRFLDAFALMGDLLARTERTTVFSDVASLPLRPPATLAKTAASLDVMSGGRFELGLGAGAFWDAIVAMGGPRRTPGESVEALEEAVEIIRAAWRGDTSVRFSGRHYTASGFRPGPPPAHDIGIWIGAYKPRMLRLTGRLADGWVPSLMYASPEDLGEMRRRVDAAAEEAGRDPAAIRRVLNIGGVISDGPVEGLLRGPADH
jgi:alkanesulfonate monooxygenase SsuD/methylene tetrahydromethanopterin reductase-like flavin-dependent oxidoreductase (luciferase family)